MSSRSKEKFSRVVQVSLSGRLLKRFDEETIYNEETESYTGRILIDKALKDIDNAKSKPNKNFFTE
ncbi:hypothetical protein UFOVP1106_54 [uncultured Caudovirales phage]|uniref:Uncharacterized protein n=1 Tax=uncultured Caudovirales phage TaxID=2100421 RepID=A0A6J5QMC1_9CAUD|nr:hypothetical protein UFOVP1106_54 [uncultured Caudovirales phage]